MKIMLATLAVPFVAFNLFAQEEIFPRLDDRAEKKWVHLVPQQAFQYHQSFVISPNGQELICDNGHDLKRQGGALWTIDLNQKDPAAITVSAESCSEGVGGSGNSGYSLYLDVNYMDGSSLWGQSALFDPSLGKTWHMRSVTVVPDRPIRRISAFVLFREVQGKAHFRNMRYYQATVSAGNQFDSCMVKPTRIPTFPCFLIRDVAANSGFAEIRDQAKGVRMDIKKTKGKGATFFDVTLENLTGKDRALTLSYVLPLPQGKIVWHVDARKSWTLNPTSSQRMSASSVNAGTGFISSLPFIAVSAGENGYALGGDPTAPAFSRMVCHPAMHLLHFSTDLALTPEVPKAHFRFCSFQFNSADAFRGALEKYYTLFPENFAVRLKKQGVWMAFEKISKVEGWEDFGFRFKEGDDEPDWDDAHDIVTFKYTEPATWWMPMWEESYSYEDCIKRVNELASQGDLRALAWKSSAFKNESGKTPGELRDTPWCRGIVWSMNSAPHLKGNPSHYDLYNSETDFAKRYSKKFPKGVDGEYIDSSELGLVTTLDFCRAHFTGMRTPLCFSKETFKPAIFKGAIGYEYVRSQADRVHSRGRFSMANGTPINWWWLAPYLDVMGTETNWKLREIWQPISDSQLMYKRSLCGAKPFCFLMNTDFTKFTYACSKKFMMRSLAYGMFPGYFSANGATEHYFTQPALYNRDRPLFKKYLPLCKRVAEAGWRPVNRLLTSSNEKVITEQFGNAADQSYATIFNLSDQPQTVTIKWLKRAPKPVELVTGKTWRWDGKKLTVTIPAETVRLLAF